MLVLNDPPAKVFFRVTASAMNPADAVRYGQTDTARHVIDTHSEPLFLELNGQPNTARHVIDTHSEPLFLESGTAKRILPATSSTRILNL